MLCAFIRLSLSSFAGLLPAGVAGVSSVSVSDASIGDEVRSAFWRCAVWLACDWSSVEESSDCRRFITSYYECGLWDVTTWVSAHDWSGFPGTATLAVSLIALSIPGFFKESVKMGYKCAQARMNAPFCSSPWPSTSSMAWAKPRLHGLAEPLPSEAWGLPSVRKMAPARR